MKHFISFIILFVILIYLGMVSYSCTLAFGNAEKIEEQQHQIEHLKQEQIKNELLIKLLMNKETKKNDRIKQDIQQGLPGGDEVDSRWND